ncbi:hypothetical protein EJ05DRAFT_327478 [Pseudovirgaria hyperparasitica]|uniref:Micro-fibrillar-associated protein 1 C-terminal domain-containing protein n=1 Tax=Pseudovirgaria hyperparasitica TaxID=470096 RepID=A0A6A6W8S3_9PEZI|nr:uncharacterized protein EJ05DRAFT_327478 [Pseudovirgaria hyperparasitica]KAF2758955.1 hypothetical protein EJ05DRAFT_327478 [Pseudovirgaria hyperparasitica]
MPPKRMTANPVRPARHRPGKALAAAPNESDSSEDDDPEEQETSRQDAPPPKATSFPKDTSKIATTLKAVDLNTQTRRDQQAQAAAAAKKKAEEDEFETENEEDEEDENESGSESGEESSSEESSSEEEEDTRRKFIRPVFIKKAQRNGGTVPEKSEEEKAEEEEARRKAEADELIQEQIERAAAEKAAGKKYWDDEDRDLEEQEAVDDTDDRDVEAEYAAWKLRELSRIRRDRARIEEYEAELAERERRRNMTAAEREAEDAERIARDKEDRSDKPQAGYMQKYFHKGAFFTDELAAQGLLDRDIMGAKFVDETNKETLPEYMRIRDMTKLGKKGRTRYKDLKSEDTGRWADYGYDRKNGGSYNNSDDRFRPDRPGATGANSAALGERKRSLASEDRESKRPRRDHG